MGRYECQNMGCQNGFGSTFELSEKEEVFYAEHGLSSPKNCADCRKWRKEQTTKYTITCEACGNSRIITPLRRINYHKKIGPWVDPTLCKQCEKDPYRALLERKRTLSDMQWLHLRGQESKKYPQQAQTISRKLVEKGLTRYANDKTGGIVSSPQAFDVLEDAEIYASITEKRDGTALAHITLEHHKSLSKLGTNDGQTLIFMGSEIARSTDSKTVTQFYDTQYGTTIKRDNLTGQIVIIIPSERTPPPSRILSTYKISDSQMIGKVESGAWIPST